MDGIPLAGHLAGHHQVLAPRVLVSDRFTVNPSPSSKYVLATGCYRIASRVLLPSFAVDPTLRNTLRNNSVARQGRPTHSCDMPFTLLRPLTSTSSSPLQGEGRGFETLSAHDDLLWWTSYSCSIRRSVAPQCLGLAVGDVLSVQARVGARIHRPRRRSRSPHRWCRPRPHPRWCRPRRGWRSCRSRHSPDVVRVRVARDRVVEDLRLRPTRSRLGCRFLHLWPCRRSGPR